MEQKAPRLSTGTLVAGALCCAFALLNGVADLVFQSGFSIEEYLAFVVAGLCFTVSFFASRERPIPELVNQPTIQEQYDALESTPTPFRTSAPVQSEHHGEPQAMQATNVQPVLAMEPMPSAYIQPPQPAPAVSQDVASALASLSSGAFGAAAAEQANQNPAPHTPTAQGREFTQSVGSLASSHERAPIQNVPLPSGGIPQPTVSSPTSHSLPSMPDLGTLLGDEPTTLSPQSPLTAVEPPSMLDLPDLSGLLADDLPVSLSTPPPALPTTPALPDLDGLF
jgi:hypothetical protein